MEEEEKKGQPSTPQELLTRLKGNRESLHIARIPPKTKEAFQKLAEEEFCSDYGMCLKFLMDDLIGTDMKMAIATLQDHESRIVVLEAPVSGPEASSEGEKKPIKLLSGRRIEKV